MEFTFLKSLLILIVYASLSLKLLIILFPTSVYAASLEKEPRPAIGIFTPRIFSESKGMSSKCFWARYPDGWSTENQCFPFLPGGPGHCPSFLRSNTHCSLLGSDPITAQGWVVQAMNPKRLDLAVPQSNSATSINNAIGCPWPLLVPVYTFGQGTLVVLLLFFCVCVFITS